MKQFETVTFKGTAVAYQRGDAPKGREAAPRLYGFGFGDLSELSLWAALKASAWY